MNGLHDKERILQATDIVRLIGDHVAIRARGKEFVGLCPFHDDRTPSLTVSPAKQIFKCFACGAGGDALSFLMDFHKMSFPEALAWLGERAGIKLDDRDRTSQTGPRQMLLKAHQWALRFYRRILREDPRGQTARQYVEQRRISPKMAEAFQIGAAPEGWDSLAGQASADGQDLGLLVQAGLMVARESGDGHYDRFRHRLMFPILDNLGRPMAFGGRRLRETDEPKYLNSPEHALFNKSQTLFGLHLAQRPIIESRTAIIVEGYTDTIAAHAAGFTNAVATLGTALTADHARNLRRYCDKVILVFDGDEAGQKASDRALEIFFREPLDIAIVVLPQGLDPADLLAQEDGIARFRQALEQGADAMDFRFQRFSKTFQDNPTHAGKQRLTQEFLHTLHGLGFENLEAARKGLVITHLAHLLRVDVPTVDGMIRKLQEQRPGPRTTPTQNIATAPRPSAQVQAQRHVIGFLLMCPGLLDQTLAPDGRPLSEVLTESDFSDPICRRLFPTASASGSDQDPWTPARLREVIEEEDLLRQALDMLGEADRAAVPPQQPAQLLAAEAASLIRVRAEAEFQQARQQLQQEEVDEADKIHRLELTVAHMRNNPRAERTPRVAR